jgi:hypothetical protein
VVRAAETERQWRWAVEAQEQELESVRGELAAGDEPVAIQWQGLRELEERPGLPERDLARDARIRLEEWVVATDRAGRGEPTHLDPEDTEFQPGLALNELSGLLYETRVYSSARDRVLSDWETSDDPEARAWRELRTQLDRQDLSNDQRDLLQNAIDRLMEKKWADVGVWPSSHAQAERSYRAVVDAENFLEEIAKLETVWDRARGNLAAGDGPEAIQWQGLRELEERPGLPERDLARVRDARIQLEQWVAARELESLGEPSRFNSENMRLRAQLARNGIGRLLNETNIYSVVRDQVLSDLRTGDRPDALVWQRLRERQDDKDLTEDQREALHDALDWIMAKELADAGVWGWTSLSTERWQRAIDDVTDFLSETASQRSGSGRPVGRALSEEERPRTVGRGFGHQPPKSEPPRVWRSTGDQGVRLRSVVTRLTESTGVGRALAGVGSRWRALTTRREAYRLNQHADQLLEQSSWAEDRETAARERAKHAREMVTRAQELNARQRAGVRTREALNREQKEHESQELAHDARERMAEEEWARWTRAGSGAAGRVSAGGDSRDVISRWGQKEVRPRDARAARLPDRTEGDATAGQRAQQWEQRARRWEQREQEWRSRRLERKRLSDDSYSKAWDAYPHKQERGRRLDRKQRQQMMMLARRVDELQRFGAVEPARMADLGGQVRRLREGLPRFAPGQIVTRASFVDEADEKEYVAGDRRLRNALAVNRSSPGEDGSGRESNCVPATAAAARAYRTGTPVRAPRSGSMSMAEVLSYFEPDYSGFMLWRRSRDWIERGMSSPASARQGLVVLASTGNEDHAILTQRDEHGAVLYLDPAIGRVLEKNDFDWNGKVAFAVLRPKRNVRNQQFVDRLRRGLGSFFSHAIVRSDGPEWVGADEFAGQRQARTSEDQSETELRANSDADSTTPVRSGGMVGVRPALASSSVARSRRETAVRQARVMAKMVDRMTNSVQVQRKEVGDLAEATKRNADGVPFSAEESPEWGWPEEFDASALEWKLDPGADKPPLSWPEYGLLRWEAVGNAFIREQWKADAQVAEARWNKDGDAEKAALERQRTWEEMTDRAAEKRQAAEKGMESIELSEHGPWQRSEWWKRRVEQELRLNEKQLDWLREELEKWQRRARAQVRFDSHLSTVEFNEKDPTLVVSGGEVPSGRRGLVGRVFSGGDESPRFGRLRPLLGSLRRRSQQQQPVEVRRGSEAGRGEQGVVSARNESDVDGRTAQPDKDGTVRSGAPVGRNPRQSGPGDGREQAEMERAVREERDRQEQEQAELMRARAAAIEAVRPQVVREELVAGATTRQRQDWHWLSGLETRQIRTCDGLREQEATLRASMDRRIRRARETPMPGLFDERTGAELSNAIRRSNLAFQRAERMSELSSGARSALRAAQARLDQLRTARGRLERVMVAQRLERGGGDATEVWGRNLGQLERSWADSRAEIQSSLDREVAQSDEDGPVPR